MAMLECCEVDLQCFQCIVRSRRVGFRFSIDDEVKRNEGFVWGVSRAVKINDSIDQSSNLPLLESRGLFLRGL